MKIFHDCVIGGAWPFLVRGVICLLNCVLKNSKSDQIISYLFFEIISSCWIYYLSNERDRDLMLQTIVMGTTIHYNCYSESFVC